MQKSPLGTLSTLCSVHLCYFIFYSLGRNHSQDKVPDFPMRYPFRNAHTVYVLYCFRKWNKSYAFLPFSLFLNGLWPLSKNYFYPFLISFLYIEWRREAMIYRIFSFIIYTEGIPNKQWTLFSGLRRRRDLIYFKSRIIFTDK